jgi:cytochrome o ubiquinol oxidase subunit 2
MLKKQYLYVILPALLVVGIIVVGLLTGEDFALLNSKGLIAASERNLALIAIGIMLVVVIPIFILEFLVSKKFSEHNKKAVYDPNWNRSKLLVFVWWTVPTVVVLILGINNWNATHKLDPFRAIESDKRPLKIQVISLQWKWLFIYPEQNIATVNYLVFPEKTPINFELTSDAPMNSFWIPSLGGQVYAMTGMGTKLHLIADKTGEFRGSAAEISGRGFSGMRFMAKSVSDQEFSNWVMTIKKSQNRLDLDQYEKLAIPSENTPPLYYSSTEPDLYNKVMQKYMSPMHH